MIARLLAVTLALSATGCCRILAALEEGNGRERDPSPTGPATDLGLAAYPASTPSARATNHTWNLHHLPYRLFYALGASEADDVDADLQGFARKVDYQPQGKDRFRWRPPSGCAAGIACVYQNLAARSAADVAPISARFRARAKSENLNAIAAAEMVITFVQSIPYEIPEQEPFGVLPPALVASQRKGDCDSKSLLAHMILHDLGIETMMVGSSAHHHEMLGIALPSTGTKFTYAGRDYAFTELTAKGSPIGHINPKLLSPNDWKPMPFEMPRGSVPADPAPGASGKKPPVGPKKPKR